MDENPHRHGEAPTAEMWKVIREHHGDLAKVQGDIDGVKKDVLALGRNVDHLSGKVDEILAAVTRATSRERPTLMEYMGGLVMLLTIVGGLALGIASYVGSLYDAKITSIESDAQWARDELGRRNAEDRTELVYLRQQQDAAVAARIAALEAQAGWAPQMVTRGP